MSASSRRRSPSPRSSRSPASARSRSRVPDASTSRPRRRRPAPPRAPSLRRTPAAASCSTTASTRRTRLVALSAGRPVGVQHAAGRRHAVDAQRHRRLPLLGLPRPADRTGQLHAHEPAPGSARRRRREPQDRVVERPQLLQRGRRRRRVPDLARCEHAVRVPAPAREGGQRARGHERRHRRPDGDGERRGAEQRGRRSGRRR